MTELEILQARNLALIAENEHLEAWRTAFLSERSAHIRQRDQLKAENEALRLDAERYRWLREYTIRSLPVEGALESLDRQIDSRRGKEARS